MAKYAHSASEANRLYLIKAEGTCPDCGAHFHRLREGHDIPAHVAGEAIHQWEKKVWSNGIVTYYPASRRGFRRDHKGFGPNGENLCKGSGAEAVPRSRPTKGEPGPKALSDLFRIG